MVPADWDSFLAAYHSANSGITERLLLRAESRQKLNPYGWLLAAVPTDVLVLDLGCGSAPLQPQLTGRYLGIDRSGAELSGALDLGRSGLVLADACALPVATGSVHCVVAPMSLMLFDPVEAALAEVSRVLAPGGTFAALLPHSGPLGLADLRVAAILGITLRQRPAFPQRLSRSSLQLSAERAGLRIRTDTAMLFRMPIRDVDDAVLAIDSLYLPGLDPRRRSAAIRALAHRAGSLSLPIPLRRVIATRSADVTK